MSADDTVALTSPPESVSLPDEPSAAEQATWPPYQRPTDDQLATILRLTAEGMSGLQIVKHTGFSPHVVYGTRRRFRSTTDMAKQLLHAGALEAVELWRDKAIPKAAARGDHRPAMDLLKAAKVIDDQPLTQQIVIVGNGQVTAQTPDPWAGIERPILEAKVVESAEVITDNKSTTLQPVEP